MLRIKFISSLPSPILICDHHSITYENSLKVYFLLPLLVGINQSTSKVWDIHSTIRLSRYPKFISHKLRKSCKPGFYCCCVIACSPALIIYISCIIIYRKSYSWRWLEKEKVGFLIPRIWIKVTRKVGWTCEQHIWAYFLAEAQ